MMEGLSNLPAEARELHQCHKLHKIRKFRDTFLNGPESVSGAARSSIKKCCDAIILDS